MSTFAPYSFCFTTSGAICRKLQQTTFITLETVIIAYPIRCADHRRTFALGFCELGAEAKVTNLDFSLKVEEDIVRLDVSVDNVLRVEMVETGRCLRIRLSI